MAIAFVQTATLGSTGSGASQQTSAFGSNPTVGNYLVAWAWGWNSTVTHLASHFVFSDTGSNAWSPLGFQSLSADLWLIMGYAKVATGSASHKITMTLTGESTGSVMVCGSEFSGVASTSPLDGAAVGTTGTTGIPAPGSLSLTAGDLVLALMTTDQTTYTTFGYSTPTGFTRVGMQNDGSTFQVGEAVYAINPSSPTNPAWKTGTVKWAANQFALKAASVAGATAYPAALLMGM